MSDCCVCGAVGRVLPAELAHALSHLEPPLMEWRGGRIGYGRIAVETARSGVVKCPACQHRASVFMLAGDDSHAGC